MSFRIAFLPACFSLLSLPLLAAPGEGGGFGFRQVSPGVFRGGRPAAESRYLWLAEKGIRNIINLQGRGSPNQPGEKPSEIAAAEEWARRLGIGYHRRPFSTGQEYVLSQEEKASILNAVSLLRDPKFQPAYVHCFFGVDRTGITIASFRILVEGCSFEKARDEMYRQGNFWTPQVTRGQLPFLQELTGFDRPSEANCPL